MMIDNMYRRAENWAAWTASMNLMLGCKRAGWMELYRSEPSDFGWADGEAIVEARRAPVDEADALVMDEAIQALPERLRLALACFYLRRGELYRRGKGMYGRARLDDLCLVVNEALRAVRDRDLKSYGYVPYYAASLIAQDSAGDAAGAAKVLDSPR